MPQPVHAADRHRALGNLDAAPDAQGSKLGARSAIDQNGVLLSQDGGLLVDLGDIDTRLLGSNAMTKTSR